jgi:hypothetical protein
MSRFEIEWRREYNESFRPGKSFEFDIALLADNTAAPVSANQISARMRFHPIGAAHIDTDHAIGLRNPHHLVRKQNVDVGQLSQALKKDLGGFKLLALNDKWMTGVVLKDNVIKLGDLLAAGPVPELENGRHQPDARHLVRETIIGQQVERGRMSGGSPWIRLQGFVDVEKPDRQATASEQPRAQQADRAPSSNQYSPFIKHTRKNCCLFISASAIRLQFATTVLKLKVAKKSRR